MVAKRAGHTIRGTAERSSKAPTHHERTTSANEIQEFVVGEYVFNPEHGEGKVIAIEDTVIAGETVKLMWTRYAQGVALRTPVAKAASFGLRKLTNPAPDTVAIPTGTASVAPIADLDPTPPLVPATRAQPDIVTDLLRYGYSEDEIFALVIPKRTLARRRAAHEPLTIEETDKAMRLMRIATQAQRVFGDPGKAHRWLRKPKHALNGETPIAFLASEEGARIVEEMLHRIDHGMAA